MKKREKLFERVQRQNVFWSYDLKSSDQISDALFIEHVLIYSDVDDIKQLFLTFSKEKIKQVWDDKIVPDKRYRRLNFYLANFFFNIENIETYIEEKTSLNSRYEKIKRLVSQN